MRASGGAAASTSSRMLQDAVAAPSTRPLSLARSRMRGHSHRQPSRVPGVQDSSVRCKPAVQEANDPSTSSSSCQSSREARASSSYASLLLPAAALVAHQLWGGLAPGAALAEEALSGSALQLFNQFLVGDVPMQTAQAGRRRSHELHMPRTACGCNGALPVTVAARPPLTPLCAFHCLDLCAGANSGARAVGRGAFCVDSVVGGDGAAAAHATAVTGERAHVWPQGGAAALMQCVWCSAQSECGPCTSRVPVHSMHFAACMGAAVMCVTCVCPSCPPGLALSPSLSPHPAHPRARCSWCWAPRSLPSTPTCSRAPWAARSQSA